MIRGIAGIVVSYILMVVLTIGMSMIVVGVSPWSWGSGFDLAERIETLRRSVFWNLALVIGAICLPMVGGWTCARIARGRTAVMVLAVLVLVLGQVSLYTGLNREIPAERETGMTVLQVMETSRMPVWFTLFSHFLQAGGILIGGLVLAERKFGAGARVGVTSTAAEAVA